MESIEISKNLEASTLVNEFLDYAENMSISLFKKNYPKTFDENKDRIKAYSELFIMNNLDSVQLAGVDAKAEKESKFYKLNGYLFDNLEEIYKGDIKKELSEKNTNSVIDFSDNYKIHDESTDKDFNAYVNDIQAKCKALLESKGHDYAQNNNRYSNFESSAIIAGVSVEQSFLVLIGTKIARLRELITQGKQANNESIEDSLIDCQNYLLLLGGFLKGVK